MVLQDYQVTLLLCVCNSMDLDCGVWCYKIIRSHYYYMFVIVWTWTVVCGVTRLSGHVLLHFSWRAGISNISPANNYQ